MWPWKRQPTVAEVPQDHSDRLRSVEKTLEDLAISHRKLRLEWEDVYDRISKAVARLNARDRAEQKREGRAQDDGAPQTLDEINAAIRRGAPPTAFRRQ